MRSEKKWLSESAHVLRYGIGYKSVRPEQLLETRRVEDKENNLWKVFNVIQENVIKGELNTQTLLIEQEKQEP